MKQTVCSETSAYKIQTPGNYPKESTQYVINMYLYVDKEKVFDGLKHMQKFSCAVMTIATTITAEQTDNTTGLQMKS